METPFLLSCLSLLIGLSPVHAAPVVWESNASLGAGDSPTVGSYYAMDGINRADVTWTGSGQMGLEVVGDPSFNNTFAIQQMDDTAGSSILWTFNSVISDDDGFVDTVFSYQRGDYELKMTGGAIWTTSEVLNPLLPESTGYTITGLGTDTLMVTRGSSADPNSYLIDFRYGISGGFTSLKIFWAPDGVVTAGDGGLTNDLLGLKFGDLSATAVPEPGSVALAGMIGMLALRRRRLTDKG